MHKLLLSISFLAVLLGSAAAVGASAIPTGDLKGSRDDANLGRYDGSIIVSYEHKRYDQFIIPLDALVRVAGKKGPMNNALFRARESKTLEGAFTRITYLLPPGRSPLEVLRNYQQEIRSTGGDILFECEGAECGGAANRSSGGGGGLMSLGMVLLPNAQIGDAHFSPGSCATRGGINGQRYTAAAMRGGTVHVAVHAYELVNQFDCKYLNGRTIANIYVLEQEVREQKMVVVEAKEMAEKIMSAGSVALYGIHFDSDKAVLKPASDPTLAEIGRLLADDPELKLLVVGHTDSQGAFDYNLDLSQRRADTVVSRLTADYGVSPARLRPVGVSYASPVASNSTEVGRAKNRRVELVADSR